MSDLISLMINTFDEEITKLSVEQDILGEVVEFYMKQSIGKNYHSFFINRNLTILTSEIFESPEIRDFVLNLTIKINILLHLEKYDASEIYNIIATAVTPSNDTLIPALVSGAIKPTIDIKSTLANNDWLLVTFITIVFFEKSEAFQEYSQQITRGH